MRVKDEHSHSINTGRCRPTVAKSTLSSHSARIMNTTTSSTKRSTLSSRHATIRMTSAAPVAMACGILRPVFLLMALMALFGFFFELFLMFHHVPCLAVRRFFSGDEGLSDLHDLLLLGFEQGIKFISGLLGDLVELLEQTIALVLTISPS